MRIATGDVMTALSRACMMLCTGMIGLLCWQAQGMIDHMKEQDKKIEAMAIQQTSEDGTSKLMQMMIGDTQRRVSKLEDAVYTSGVHYDHK